MKTTVQLLNVRQERFCENVALGVSATDSYMKAGYKATKDAAGTAGPRLLENVAVKARLAELRKLETKAALQKKDDILRFLSSIITTPLSQIGPDSPLCVEFTEEIIRGGTRGALKPGKAPLGNETTGETIIRRRIKKPDPLRAIELYSRLLGHFEPDRTEIEVGPMTLLSIKERASQVASALALRYQQPKK